MPRALPLHESVGVKAIGLCEKVSYKFGAWWGVAWFRNALRSDTDNPQPPTASRGVPGALMLCVSGPRDRTGYPQAGVRREQPPCAGREPEARPSQSARRASRLPAGRRALSTR
jgi:hypothetical protein